MFGCATCVPTEQKQLAGSFWDAVYCTVLSCWKLVIFHIGLTMIEIKQITINQVRAGLTY